MCWDGLLNFGLHQSGVFTLGCVLMGLAPALGNTPARPWGPKPVSIAAAVLLGVLTVALLMGRVPAALRADVSRDRARYEHVEAARRANSGDTTGGRVLLQETLVDFDAAVADYPGDVRTWLERGSVLRSLGRSDEAVASVERAVALAPWAADLRDELGLLLLLSDTRHAIQAFDEAVRLYPSHPGYRLHAGEARARLAGEGLANEERQRVVSEAREELLNALRISEATRLVRLKLSDPETSRITKLLSELKTR